MYCISASLLERARPTYAIVDLSTNDLVSGSTPHQVSGSVANFATSLTRTYGIRHVTICQIVSRHNCTGRLTPAQFADLANKINQHLARMCDGEESLSFHAHEGLTDRKITLWSRDGIHPNTREGRKLYIRSLQRAFFSMYDARSHGNSNSCSREDPPHIPPPDVDPSAVRSFVKSKPGLAVKDRLGVAGTVHTTSVKLTTKRKSIAIESDSSDGSLHAAKRPRLDPKPVPSSLKTTEDYSSVKGSSELQFKIKTLEEILREKALKSKSSSTSEDSGQVKLLDQKPNSAPKNTVTSPVTASKPRKRKRLDRNAADDILPKQSKYK